MAANVDVALLVAGLDNDFNLRRIERYLAVAWSSGDHARSSCSTRRTSPTTSTAGWSRSTRSRRACPSIAVSARTGAGLDDLRAHLRPGATAAILGSSGVGKSTLVNALLGEDRQATAEVREVRLARPPHDDPPRAVRAAGRGAPRRHAGHPRARGPRARTRAWTPHSTTSSTSPRPAGSATAATTASPAARSASRSPTGRLTAERLASHRKLERELARAARESDPRARAEDRRTWKIIHKSVDEHMQRKYGGDT